MKRKRFCLLVFCLICLFSLSGCSLNPDQFIFSSAPLCTPPVQTITFPVPIGDAGLEYSKTVQLVLPSLDGRSLILQEAELTCVPSRSNEESLIRLLLDYIPGDQYDALGGSIKLSLFGSEPVEVSRDTAAVHLSASAKQLEKSRQYLVCQAITNTLYLNSNIANVCFLIGEKPFALDEADELPCGALTYKVSQDYLAVYQELLDKSVSLQVGTSSSLTQKLLLYSPLQGTEGIIAFSNDVSFSSLSFENVIINILCALCAISNKEAQQETLPNFSNYLVELPTVDYCEDVHGPVADLHFDCNYLEALSSSHLQQNVVDAAICMSLTTYMSDIVGIRILIDTNQATDIDLNGTCYLREKCSLMLLDYCTLFLPQKETGQIVSVLRPVPSNQTWNLRSLISHLCKASSIGDSRQDTLPVFSVSEVEGSDILGFCNDNHSLIVNFSSSFIRNQKMPDGISEQQMAYAITNTLCYHQPWSCVYILQGGSWFEDEDQQFTWQGLFYPISTND